MTSPRQDETNPYQPPDASLEGPAVPVPLGAAAGEMVKKFREQILALGVLWIIIGTLSAGLGGAALAGNKDIADAFGNVRALQMAVFGLGLTWVVLGVLSCMKNVGAVMFGLVLSYLSLLLNVLSLNLCGIAIVILVILQAHRVISWSKRMKAAGVPFTTRP